MDAEWYSGEQVAACSCVADCVIQIQGKEDIFLQSPNGTFRQTSEYEDRVLWNNCSDIHDWRNAPPIIVKFLVSNDPEISNFDDSRRRPSSSTERNLTWMPRFDCFSILIIYECVE